MLTKIKVKALAVALLVSGFLVIAQEPAHADYIYCPPNSGPCILIVTSGGGGGGGGGSGGSGGSGSAKCYHEQLGYISCYRQGMGWFNPNDGCYYNRLDLAANDPLWGGHNPANGYIYAVWCWEGLSAGWVLEQFKYLTSSPPGYGGLPSPLALAVQAINKLPIVGPKIGLAPSPTGSGLVGLPVWMWTSVSSTTWGPISASASVPGLTVTATARASKIVWNMGDGTTVTCNNPGTAYKASYADSKSPNCGYTYKISSRYQSTGRYTITATTTWNVSWSGGGRSGTVTVTRASSTSLRINELQVVVQ